MDAGIEMSRRDGDSKYDGIPSADDEFEDEEAPSPSPRTRSAPTRRKWTQCGKAFIFLSVFSFLSAAVYGVSKGWDTPNGQSSLAQETPHDNEEMMLDGTGTSKVHQAFHGPKGNKKSHASQGVNTNAEAAARAHWEKIHPGKPYPGDVDGTNSLHQGWGHKGGKDQDGTKDNGGGNNELKTVHHKDPISDKYGPGPQTGMHTPGEGMHKPGTGMHGQNGGGSGAMEGHGESEPSNTNGDPVDNEPEANPGDGSKPGVNANDTGDHAETQGGDVSPTGKDQGAGEDAVDGGEGLDKIEICEHSKYSDWLETTVTQSDGAMFEVIEQMEHDPAAFTQGLTYAEGQLWESTGVRGESTVRILNPDSGQVVDSVKMEKTLFGEGMTYWEGNLVQITWTSKKGFVYNATTLETIKEFDFETTNGEGWGITWDPCATEFIVTDGTPNLHFWDPETLTQTRKVPVTRQDGQPAKELNEIEWWRGRILANVWYEDVLLVIDPETGNVEKEYDFKSLWPKKERPHGTNVFNGISVSADPDILYVTGKKWNRMFRVRLLH